MRPHNLSIIFTYLIVLSTSFIVFLDDRYIVWRCKEDGPVENISAVFFITDSLLFFAAYIFSSGAGNDLWLFRTNRNIFYPLLGILFFACFGEE